MRIRLTGKYAWDVAAAFSPHPHLPFPHTAEIQVSAQYEEQVREMAFDNDVKVEVL